MKHLLIILTFITLLSSCQQEETQFNRFELPKPAESVVIDTNDPRCIEDVFNETGIYNPNYSGILATLYDGGTSQYSKLSDYFEIGQKVDVNIIFNDINVPTRRFDQGFVKSSGEFLADTNGEKLIEYFALNFRGKIKLADDEAEGTYEFALLSDDGAILDLYVNDTKTNFISYDDNTATRMSCSTQTIQMTRDKSIEFDLKYFQGPRYHIAVMLMWRKLEDPNNRVSEENCGQRGSNMYFDTSVSPSLAKQPYLDLLDRGWKVLRPENYALPTVFENEVNYCLEID